MSTERWVFLNQDGQLMMHEENDGWSFLKRGAQAREWPVTLEGLKATYNRKHHDDAVKLLAERGAKP